MKTVSVAEDGEKGSISGENQRQTGEIKGRSGNSGGNHKYGRGMNYGPKS
jgi:hypothetical protein